MVIRSIRAAVWLGALLAALAGCNNAPTLPLPPPNALVESPPDAEGLVTIEVSGAQPGALVLALNDRTGQGTIDTADDAGEATLRLGAQAGDLIQVWQRVGTDSGELQTVQVPGDGRDAGPPDGG